MLLFLSVYECANLLEKAACSTKHNLLKLKVRHFLEKLYCLYTCTVLGYHYKTNGLAFSKNGF